MPIWVPSLVAAGFDPERRSSRRSTSILADSTLDADFLLHAGPLGDILPIPLPLIRNVASIGDLFLTAGLAFFLFATGPALARARHRRRTRRRRRGRLLQRPGRRPPGLPRGVKATRPGPARPPRDRASRPAWPRPPTARSAAHPRRAAARASSAPGLVGGRRARRRSGRSTRPAPTAPSPSRRRPDRRRRAASGAIPYVRLALNGSFSALWTGQLISLFGDRVHQIALAFLVLGVTHSPLAVAFVFVAATLPNLLLVADRRHLRRPLGPARRDDRQRPAPGGGRPAHPDRGRDEHLPRLPARLPVTSISIFFRPARVASCRGSSRGRAADRELGAVGRRDVRRRHRLPAGGPLRRASSAPALPLAFWIDAATYAASAVLIASIVVPAVQRRRRRARARTASRPTGVIAEMREGFRVPAPRPGPPREHDPGDLRPVRDRRAHGPDADLRARDRPRPRRSSIRRRPTRFLETAIGVGNLVGGFVDRPHRDAARRRAGW